MHPINTCAYRGVPNAPFYLPFIAQTVADLKQVSVEELLSVTYQNSLDCFFKIYYDL